MPKLRVTGTGQPLRGSVKISGAKNAAVAILPAAILASAPVTVENLPDIKDIRILTDILTLLGVKVTKRENSLTLDAANINNWKAPYELVKKLRASYYFLGSLVGRFGYAEVPVPGGCDLGPRPIDQHIKGLAAMGANVEVEHGMIRVGVEKGRLQGANIYLDIVSVGATINIMLAAALAEGKTVIENAAKEPEIVDVANFLNGMGASIRGAGTDVIKINGVDKLGSVTHTVIPDRIEAGTYMIAAAATGGDVVVHDVIPKHLEPIIAKLKEMDVEVEVADDRIRVNAPRTPRAADVKTFPYPGFPTDLQSLIMILLIRAEGSSLLTENVFEGRFRHVDELIRMGATIKVEGRAAVIEGSARLTGAPVCATDLRAGASFIVAGLIAEGDTVISDVEHIYRGYENICEKLTKLGAVISEEKE